MKDCYLDLDDMGLRGDIPRPDAIATASEKYNSLSRKYKGHFED